MFHTERKGCTSSLYLETKHLKFVQNSTYEEPPVDYFVYVRENFHVEGIVTELTLNDVFSVGPNYQVTVIRGNYYLGVLRIESCKIID